MDDSLLFAGDVDKFVVVVTVPMNTTGSLDEIILGIPETVANEIIPTCLASLPLEVGN